MTPPPTLPHDYLLLSSKALCHASTYRPVICPTDPHVVCTPSVYQNSLPISVQGILEALPRSGKPLRACATLIHTSCGCHLGWLGVVRPLGIFPRCLSARQSARRFLGLQLLRVTSPHLGLQSLFAPIGSSLTDSEATPLSLPIPPFWVSPIDRNGIQKGLWIPSLVHEQLPLASHWTALLVQHRRGTSALLHP